jgi:hypothetical protein
MGMGLLGGLSKSVADSDTGAYQPTKFIKFQEKRTPIKHYVYGI